MKTIIIHHASCFDGVAGAWVANRAVLEDWGGLSTHPIEIIPATYGDNPPDCTGANVIIVDFSYKKPILEKIADVAESLTVIDHHKTAQEDLEGFSRGNIFFDMERSGAGLAWDVFFPKQVRPWFIDCVEDRDLWRFKLPWTKDVIAYLAARELTIETFEALVHAARSVVARDGSVIQEYINNFGKKAAVHFVIKRIAGYDVPVINVPYMNSSDHVDTLMKMLPGHPFYAYFFMRASGWQFGLRSLGDFDVSKIAQQFGGGGHKNASGFTVTVLPWAPFEDMMKGSNN